MSKVKTSILPNTDNVDVSNHEILYTHQINRNINKLIENDKKLNELFKKAYGSVIINEYIEFKAYQIDDLIWFYDENLEKLKILRCIIRNNTTKPTFIDGSYEKSGWHDEYEKEELSSYGLDITIDKNINTRIVQHQNTTTYHKYGRLSKYKQDVDNVLMKTDLSNRNKRRELNFYPYQNYALESDETIITGFYRRYDNGLIEYDIIFKLGSDGTIDIDGETYNKIVCNNLYINPGDDYEEINKKYFNEYDSASIFNYKNNRTNNYCIQGSNVHTNRNDYVNVYSATIKFPVSFRDTNYMIFVNDTASQVIDQNTSTIVAGSNSMTFVNKRKKEVTPLLITFAQNNFSKVNYNSQNGCLISNRFSCKIIGMVDE